MSQPSTHPKLRQMALTETYVRRLVRRARRMIERFGPPRSKRASDIAQEALRRGFSRVRGGELAPDEALKWIHGAVAIVAREAADRRGPRGRVRPLPDSKGHEALAAGDVSLAGARIELVERLLWALEKARLTPAHSEILVAHYLERKTSHEIAAELRILPDSVRRKLTRAKAALRKAVEDAGGEPRDD
jgi:RNA polymerase sigma factor (sigma-70 family)